MHNKLGNGPTRSDRKVITPVLKAKQRSKLSKPTHYQTPLQSKMSALKSVPATALVADTTSVSVALQQNTLGVGFSGSGFLILYLTGVSGEHKVQPTNYGANPQ